MFLMGNFVLTNMSFNVLGAVRWEEVEKGVREAELIKKYLKLH